MPSCRALGLLRLSTLLCLSALTPGCVSTPPLVTTLAALDCASLIPNSYRKPVASVGLLRVGATVGDLATALDGQTARLDQANGRTQDVIDIAEACKARQAEVLKALQPKPWWKVWG